MAHKQLEAYLIYLLYRKEDFLEESDDEIATKKGYQRKGVWIGRKKRDSLLARIEQEEKQRIKNERKH